MPHDHAPEAAVLDLAADTLTAHPEWDHNNVLTYLRSFAQHVREGERP